MAYFEPSIDAEGIHIPTYDDIMEQLMTSYRTIFGADAVLRPETKDYQLLSIFAKCLDDYAALAVDCYNARNPNYASGDSLDMLLPLVSMTRRSATYSKVTLTLSGTAGTEIPAGSSAVDENGYLWNTDEDCEIGVGGTVNVSATCEEEGAIKAPAGTINTVYSTMLGWDEVTNANDAMVGTNAETDDEVRVRRKASVGTSDNGTYDALVRGLLSLTYGNDVIRFAKVLVNDTNSTDSDGLPAHSICCVVDGLVGHEDLIAERIWKCKAPGISTYGGPEGATRKSITYIDAYGNSNVINFARPVTKAVTVVVNLKKNAAMYDSDRVSGIIKSALMESVNNLGIGNSWSVTTAYRDIYNAFAGEVCPFTITSVTGIASGMQSASAEEVPAEFNEVLTLSASAITINATT